MIDQGKDFHDIIEKVRKRQDVSQLYKIFPLNLAAARNDEELFQGGFYLQLIDATDTVASIDIRLNERANDVVTLKKGDIIVAPFYRIFLSNAIQAGKTCSLAVSPNYDLFRVLRSGQTINSIDTIVNPVIAKPYYFDRAVAGQMFGGFTEINLANINEVQLFNPAGSGKTVVVTKVVIREPSGGGQFLHYGQWNTALATDAGTGFNLSNGGAASAAHLRTANPAAPVAVNKLLGLQMNASIMIPTEWNRLDVLGEGEGVIVQGETGGIGLGVSFEWMEF